MSLGCARCGDCCDPVGLSPDIQDVIWPLPGEEMVGDLDPSIRFALHHWVAYEGPLREGWTMRGYRCDRFNTISRLCEAYDERPPVCNEFPWYGDAEGDAARSAALPPRCSYALDTAPPNRRADARPLIPITVRSS